MRFPVIDDYLRRETTAEIWHKNNPGKISRLYNNSRYFNEVREGVYHTSYAPEFAVNNLIVMKASRFTKLYPGFHDYFEVTFIYSGNSVYYINNNAIHLKEGDIIIISKEIVRSTDYTDENDIIMNIVFKEELLDLAFLSSISTDEFILDFFSNHFFSNTLESGYIVIRNSDNHLLNLALECVCTLYYSERKFIYSTLMMEYFRILLQQIIAEINEQTDSGRKDRQLDSLMYQVIVYISKAYKNGSLNELAEQLNYNYNYLSNLIKQKLGKSFSDIKLEYQLSAAYKLVTTTDITVNEICLECGFHNRTHFYKKFTEKYGEPPGYFRK